MTTASHCRSTAAKRLDDRGEGGIRVVVHGVVGDADAVVVGRSTLSCASSSSST